MRTPDHLPRLSTGSHTEGSGRACIMNAISYLEGDREITDRPECVYWPLAAMAQILNDNICRHGGAPTYGTEICGPCSHELWKLGARLIGTARISDDTFTPILRRLNFRHVTAPQITEWASLDSSWPDVPVEMLHSPRWAHRLRNRAAAHGLTVVGISPGDALAYAATAHFHNDGTLAEAHRIVDTFEELAGASFGRDITDDDVLHVQRDAKVSVL